MERADERESWVAELGRIIGENRPEEDGAEEDGAEEDGADDGQHNTSDHPRVGPPFGPLERRDVPWTDPQESRPPSRLTWWPRAVTSS